MHAVVFAGLLSGCGPHHGALERPQIGPTVRFRPGDMLPNLGPEAQVDLGLRAACEDLAAAATSMDARLTPGAVRLAAERAGYPGVARFIRFAGDSSLPSQLLDAIPRDEAVDVGWSWRDFPDGRRWWVLGWAPRRMLLDPVPATIEAGGGVGIRVEGGVSPRLFVQSPTGAVRELDVNAGSARWVGSMDEPGPWRMEVVDSDRVELVFSVFVGGTFPKIVSLPAPVPPDDPVASAARLYAALDGLRSQHGLPPLAALPEFEPMVREQAACIAQGGEALHRSDLCPGVASRAADRFFPRGHFRENVAAATTATEAWDALLASPGHVANLLCTDCSHIAIGAAPVPGGEARIFYVWELMWFPEGNPKPIPSR